jgi:hypothetical protein
MVDRPVVARSLHGPIERRDIQFAGRPEVLNSELLMHRGTGGLGVQKHKDLPNRFAFQAWADFRRFSSRLLDAANTIHSEVETHGGIITTTASRHVHFEEGLSRKSFPTPSFSTGVSCVSFGGTSKVTYD